jgi:hypothetical protein
VFSLRTGFHIESDNGNITGRHSVNQPVYGKLPAKCFVFRSCLNLQQPKIFEEISLLFRTRLQLWKSVEINYKILGKSWSNLTAGADVYCIEDCIFVEQVHLLRGPGFAACCKMGTRIQASVELSSSSNGIFEKKPQSENPQR